MAKRKIQFRKQRIATSGHSDKYLRRQQKDMTSANRQPQSVKTVAASLPS